MPLYIPQMCCDIYIQPNITLFIKLKPKHIEIHPMSNQCRFFLSFFLMDTLVQSNLYIHCIYEYVYVILKTTLIQNFIHVMMQLGEMGLELMACMGFIIYFIFICITAFFLRSVKLWVLFLFLTYVYYGFCTSEIECNSHAGHLR